MRSERCLTEWATPLAFCTATYHESLSYLIEISTQWMRTSRFLLMHSTKL